MRCPPPRSGRWPGSRRRCWSGSPRPGDRGPAASAGRSVRCAGLRDRWTGPPQAGPVVGVACAAPPPLTRTVSVDDFRARSYADLYSRLEVWPNRVGRLPDNVGIISYNLTPGVLGRSVGTLPDAVNPSGFRIVAICYSDSRREVYVGMIPDDQVTPAIEQRARARGYDALLVECPGTGDTVTVTAPPDTDGTIESSPSPQTH